RTFNGVNAIVVNTFGGNDSVRYDLLGNVFNPHVLSVDLGRGNDAFRAFFNSNDIGTRGNFLISVHGRTGSDLITVTSGRDPDTATLLQFGAFVDFFSFGAFAFDTVPSFTPGTDVARGGTLTLNLGGDERSDLIVVNLTGSIQGNLNVAARGGLVKT